MLLNYFKISLRNLTKNKIYSFINIFGLALGMATTIMIALWILDEFEYNRYFTNHDEIGQIYQNQTVNGKTGTLDALPRPMEFVLRESYGDNFQQIAMASYERSHNLKFEERNIMRTGFYLQYQGLDIFSPDIIKGKAYDQNSKNAIMLSESTAKALFGTKNPIGEIVSINTNTSLVVVAVYRDFPASTSFKNILWLIPWQYYVSQPGLRNSISHWGWNSFRIYVQLADNLSFDEVNEKIRHSKSRENKSSLKFDPEIFIFPMKDWYLRTTFDNGKQIGGRIENVWLFGIIGIFVLLLASINFINLSTARSEKRAIEVGIRKTIGSGRGQLVVQFLFEALLVVILAYILSLLLSLLFMNSFNALAGKSISFPSTNTLFWAFSIIFILVTTLISGLYPAFYLSSFKPVKVLKGTLKAGKFSALPRKILVVTQFTVSIALMIGTLVVINQVLYSKNRPIGYEPNGLIQIPTTSSEFVGKSSLMHDRLIASGGAVEMGTSNSSTTQIDSERSGYTWEGKPDDLQENFVYTEISYDYIEALGMKIVEGRSFSRDFGSDSSSVVINKTAREYLGMKDPIGKFLMKEGDNGNLDPIKIIGVVDDVVTESPYEPIKQQLYFFDRNGNNDFYNIRLNPKNSISKNLELIKETFRQNFPNTPFTFNFIDEEYSRKFDSEERVAKLAFVFTVLTLLISCLGIYGLAAYLAEQRKKELGIRKVLGASVRNLWILLSMEFVILVLISILIATPIARNIMQNWLENFSYRMEISNWIYIASGLGAMVITFITVSFQAIRAARSNPIKNLRAE